MGIHERKIGLGPMGRLRGKHALGAVLIGTTASLSACGGSDGKEDPQATLVEYAMALHGQCEQGVQSSCDALAKNPSAQATVIEYMKTGQSTPAQDGTTVNQNHLVPLF